MTDGHAGGAPTGPDDTTGPDETAGAGGTDRAGESGRAAGTGSEAPEFWEGFYRSRPQVFSGRVNPALARAARALRPGTALDLGAGEGGDTAWLAERGWTVTAVDISATALARVARRVGGFPVALERHDLAVTFPAGGFDLVSAQYLHSLDDAFPRAAILRRAASAVAPGGTLLVVGHGGLAPRGWGAPLRMPTADDVLVALALDPAAWEVERRESVERVSTGPDGAERSVPDEIVQARRR
ncbi:class I SAM-dependent methyltransferase [Streptomyces sp. NPDC051567]|uniref:class I SAM-dependent methyltransferase n=1 Tax=Streptomyces sp. NPDC051567 TaxID=3365660 RepID=UPI00378CAE53